MLGSCTHEASSAFDLEHSVSFLDITRGSVKSFRFVVPLESAVKHAENG